MQPKNELFELLQFRPHPIGDPVPWILIEQLDKSQLVQIARIQLDYQIAVNQAYGNAIQQVSNLVENVK